MLRRYLRLAAACPDAFAVSGLVVRREEAGAELEAAWGVPSFRTVAELVAALPAERLLFIVIAVPQPANAEVLAEVVATGVPALGQTPAGWTLPELRQLHEDVTLQGKRVQIAEQYLFQPAHMARLALIGSGRIGASISQAMVSAATGYHGTSLLRHYLGVGAEECKTHDHCWHLGCILPGVPAIKLRLGGSDRRQRDGVAWNRVRDDLEPDLPRRVVRLRGLLVRRGRRAE